MCAASIFHRYGRLRHVGLTRGAARNWRGPRYPLQFASTTANAKVPVPLVRALAASICRPPQATPG